MAQRNPVHTETCTRTIHMNLRGTPYFNVNSRIYRAPNLAGKLKAGDKVKVTATGATDVTVLRPDGADISRRFIYAGVVAEKRQWTRPRRLTDLEEADKAAE